ncbi:MAG TPA: hypothetical protein VLT33_00220 [Labilithrix sp.]|nr:hypothetical protein [Labilithrix sp.]
MRTLPGLRLSSSVTDLLHAAIRRAGPRSHVGASVVGSAAFALVISCGSTLGVVWQAW